METPRPILDTMLRQSILRIRMQVDLNSLMTNDVAPNVDHSADTRPFCGSFLTSSREYFPPSADAICRLVLGRLAAPPVDD